MSGWDILKKENLFHVKMIDWKTPFRNRNTCISEETNWSCLYNRDLKKRIFHNVLEVSSQWVTVVVYVRKIKSVQCLSLHVPAGDEYDHVDTLLVQSLLSIQGLHAPADGELRWSNSDEQTLANNRNSSCSMLHTTNATSHRSLNHGPDDILHI